jgi:hypothetical protein
MLIGIAVRCSVLGGTGPTQPLTLHNSTGAMCHTGQGQDSEMTECFPAQWHVIVPVLSNGWAVIGEVGKFMPISRQRIASLKVTSTAVEISIVGASIP